jgi:hypothetical protein
LAGKKNVMKPGDGGFVMSFCDVTIPQITKKGINFSIS